MTKDLSPLLPLIVSSKFTNRPPLPAPTTRYGPAIVAVYSHTREDRAMRIRDLRIGQRFYFSDVPRSWYVYRGNGWYAGGAGYDGGPWHDDANREVTPQDNLIDQWESHLRHVGNE